MGEAAKQEINRAIGAKPTLEWVSVDLIDVDGNYQREIRPQLVPADHTIAPPNRGDAGGLAAVSQTRAAA